MFKTVTFKNKPVVITAAKETKEMLRGTCFRRDEETRRIQRKAGNFFRWKSLEEVFRERFVVDQLLEAAEETRTEGLPTDSVAFDFGTPVGWEMTAPLADFQRELLEEFEPNKKSQALRIKLGLPHIQAPKTSWVTIAYRLTKRNYPGVIIHSIHPGVDAGKLKGWVPGREGRVFFHPEHPGTEML